MILQSSNMPALRTGEHTITYRNLIGKIHLFSNELRGNKGRAIIYSENREAWVYAFFATWHYGMIPVPVDFLAVSDDLQYIIGDCNPSVIFCSAGRKRHVDEALEKLDMTLRIIVLDDIESLTVDQMPEEINLDADPEATAVIIYTSGTTGKSKGVMLSYKNLQANIDAVCTHIRIYKPDDRVLMLLPLHHILPLLGTIIMPFSVGCMVAVCPGMASQDIVRTLNDNKVTIIIGVPRLYATIRKGIMDNIEKSRIAAMLFTIAQKIDSLNFSRFVFKSVHKKFGGGIKYMVCGGAALDTAVARDFRTLGFEILEGYGMSEAAPMISFSHPGKTKIGSAGHLLFCVKAEIRDNEIVVNGPNVMQGYYGKPRETACAIKDGWLYTGDLGHINSKGYIFITGRKKEIMVLSNGKNVNPEEIEAKLESLSPVIREAGVFLDGDRIKAIIVPDMHKVNALNISDIDRYFLHNVHKVYNQSVSPHKMISHISILKSDLPRTRLGKIQRFLLPSLELKKTFSFKISENIKFQEYRIIKKYIEHEKKQEVQPDFHIIMNIGFDSLDSIGLQAFIETSFGLYIEMEKLISFDNILELCEYVYKNKKCTRIEKINWSQILMEKVQIKLPATWITSNIAVNLSYIFFRCFFRFNGKGTCNIPQEPCIIVANHQSFLDGLFVAAHLKFSQMRKTFFYAKEKHIRNPVLKFLANRHNIIIMDLNHNLKESIQKMAEVLKKNKNLILFPEGTRTKDGTLGDFKKTFAILSRELNVPVVPVSINGAFKAMPKGRIFPTPFRRISVDFLKPVYPENHSYESLADKVRTLIENKLDMALCR
jgi:long-chain acyl-CoA synthetase